MTHIRYFVLTLFISYDMTAYYTRQIKIFQSIKANKALAW